MASKPGYNVLSYTSGFTPAPLMPSKRQIEETESMMKDLKPKLPEMKLLLQKLVNFIPTRSNTMEMVSEAIEFLREKHLNVSIAKVTGNSVSLVGDGLVVGGLIAAPFTLGVSLILTAVGGGVCAVGGVTSAGAGITEMVISKKKVKEVQKVMDDDYKQTKEIQEMWEGIRGKCESEAKEYPQLKYSPDDVFAVLLVCCAKIVPDKVLPKECTPSEERRERATSAYTPVKVRADPYIEKALHAFDIFSGIGSGAWSIQTGGQAIAGAALTAIIIRCAQPGCRAVNHCSSFAGISSKVVTAAKIFRFATGVGPVAIAFTAVGGIIDVVSLAYSSYQIHKRSHSSAGKELLKKLEELQKGTDQLLRMTDCLNDLFNE